MSFQTIEVLWSTRSERGVRPNGRIIAFVIFGAALYLCVSRVGNAIENPQSTPALDVVAALDNSGSMRQNDPSGLLRNAALTFAGKLNTDSQLGIVTFDTASKLVLPLTKIDRPDFQVKVERALGQITYTGKRTDIPAAIETSLYQLRVYGREGTRHVILLFTDGYVDLGNAQKNQDRAYWLTTTLVSEAQSEHVSIFSIAFADNADFELLQSLAQMTGGLYFRVPAPSDIDPVFGKIASTISSVRSETLPRQPGPNLEPPKEEAKSPWLWTGIVLAIVLVTILLWYFGIRTPSIPAIASMQDIGQHTSQPIYSVDRRVVRVGSMRRPKWNVRNDIVIPYATVSRVHAEIRFENGQFVLFDLNSKNHTYCNGKRLEPGGHVTLNAGDSLRFDAYEFRFASSPTQPQRGMGKKAVTQLADDFRAPDGVRVQSAGGNQGSTAVRGEKANPAGYRPPNETQVKPALCPNHPSAAAKHQCPVCSRSFCDTCMETWNNHRICTGCRTEIISNATPDRIREIIENLRVATEVEARTKLKPT